MSTRLLLVSSLVLFLASIGVYLLITSPMRPPTEDELRQIALKASVETFDSEPSGIPLPDRGLGGYYMTNCGHIGALALHGIVILLSLCSLGYATRKITVEKIAGTLPDELLARRIRSAGMLLFIGVGLFAMSAAVALHSWRDGQVQMRAREQYSQVLAESADGGVNSTRGVGGSTFAHGRFPPAVNQNWEAQSLMAISVIGLLVSVFGYYRFARPSLAKKIAS